MIDSMQKALDAVFEKLGLVATYMPEVGDSFEVRVFTRRPDIIEGFSITQIIAETGILEVRKTEVSDPKPGEQIDLNGQTYTIQSVTFDDPERMVWTLNCAP